MTSRFTIPWVLGLSPAPAVAAGDPVLAGLRYPMPRALFVTTADVTGDGIEDVMLASMGTTTSTFGCTVFRYTGRGDGSLQPPVQVATYKGSPFIATDFVIDLFDATGDGVLDLLIAPRRLFQGVGDGTFAAGIDMPPALIYATRLGTCYARADFDGDGDDDMAMRGLSPQSGLVTVVVHLNQSDGSFERVGVPTAASEIHVGFAAGDFDEDGNVDLVTLLDQLRFYAGLGDGSFSPAVVVPEDPLETITASDVDHDGHLDLLGLVDNGVDFDLALRLGRGDGTFLGAQVLAPGLVSSSFGWIEVADINGDGFDDVLVSVQNHPLRVVPGVGPGRFGPDLTLPHGPESFPNLAVADLNGDGLRDVVVPNRTANHLSVLIGSTTPFVDLGGGSAGSTGTPRLVGSGRPVVGSAISITLESGSGQPGLLLGGTTSLLMPFLGGVLGPLPDFGILIPNGVPVSGRWPEGIPTNTSLFLQAWVPDAGGFASTGVLAVVSQGD